MMLIKPIIGILAALGLAVCPMSVVEEKISPEQQFQTAITRYLIEAKEVDSALAEKLASLAMEYDHGILMLAIIAVESGYKKDTKSKQGAIGLAQIMANVHLDPAEIHSARWYGRPNLVDDCGITSDTELWEPANNFCAGATIYKSLFERRGSVEMALCDYVGSRSQTGKCYARRVLKERDAILQVVADSTR